MTTRPQKKRNPWKVATIALAALLFIASVFGVTVYLASGNNEPSAAQPTTSTSTTTLSTTTTPPAPPTTTTSIRASQATSAPSSETSMIPPAPPAEAVGMDMVFDGMYLPATARGWELWKEMSGDIRKVYINTATCGSSAYKANCPGFAVINLDAGFRGGVSVEDLMPYDNNPNDTIAEGKGKSGEPNCWWNQVTDNAYYGAPKALSPKVVYGGTALEHSKQPGCEFEDFQHSWRSDGKGVLVYDINPHSSNPTIGLEGLLSEVIWD